MSKVLLDGEKIPDQRLRDIFRRPPSAPVHFRRNALIVGAKGAGKTTLIRYQKEIHEGVALHVSLATEFSALAKQAALGPLASEIPKEMEHLLIGKAISLLAISLAVRLSNKGISIPRDPLLACLPENFAAGGTGITPEWMNNTKRSISRGPLEDFAHLELERPLPNFLAAAGEETQKNHGPLLVMLDRADMVPGPALIPVLDLLDQSSGYIAVLATRPGHGASSLGRTTEVVVAADHYDVLHLGLWPRSNDWISFMESALHAQFDPGSLSSLSEHVRMAIIGLSRDSIRTALELVARVLDNGERNIDELLMESLSDLRESQLVAIRKTLRPYHPDFGRFLGEVRKSISQGKVIDFPVVVEIEPRMAENLFETSRLGVFVESALRSGGLCVPEGEIWIPGFSSQKVEVPPLLLWRREDGFWNPQAKVPIQINKNESSIFKGGGPVSDPALFIAYRMDFKVSDEFRKRLKDSVTARPALARWTIRDGCVPDGANWASAIRKRLSNCRAVVGDITGMRREVLFELGFSFGLRRPVIPVVAEPTDRENLPHWLGDTQVGHYKDAGGLRGIVSAIETHAYDPEFAKPPKPPSPIPSLAVWLGRSRWNEESAEHFDAICSQEGLKGEVYSDTAPEDLAIRRGGAACLLIVCLDGGKRDALLHYICGIVISKPAPGYGTKRLGRRIFILERPGERERPLVAAGLSHCKEVSVASLDNIAEKIRTFTDEYRRWSEGSSRSELA
jgi:hypothetical protein